MKRFMRRTKKNKIYRGVAAVLAAILLFSGAFSMQSVQAAISSDSIRDKQGQIDEMEKEKDKLKGSLSNLQKMKKDLEHKKSDLKSYVAQLDGNLAEIEANIEDLKGKIEVKEGEIAITEEELQAALETEDSQQKDMVTRLRRMYEKDSSQMIEALLSAGSLNGFLTKADSMERVAAYDRLKYEEFKTNRQLVELCKEQLELEKDILDQTKKNVEIEQANLEELIDQKRQDIIAYESDIKNKAAAIAEYEQMIKEQDAEIAALEAAIAEEKRQLMEQNGDQFDYDGGKFKFPVKSYTRVSDDYGWRTHPILGVKQFHNGVDLASLKGTPIYAAYDGKVVAATYSATMGNYIMIDHGSNIYTIYMHASALYVEKGDIVIRGETIAAVGSTGRSTGPHLHFSVRKDGEYQSPWDYISKP